MFIVDVTEPAAPKTISIIPGVAASDVALATIYELGSEGGAIASRERDLLLLTLVAPRPSLAVVDLSEPTAPRLLGGVDIRAGSRALRVVRLYNPPFVQTYVITADPGGLQILDVTRPSAPTLAGNIAGVVLTTDVDVEEFPLDRAVDADGKPILDVSHEGARWASQDEFLRILSSPLIFPGDTGGDR